MAQYSHMQDQITNRVEIFMGDRQKRFAETDDFVQTIAALAIVFAFLAFGLSW